MGYQLNLLSIPSMIAKTEKKNNRKLNYVSLFSSAGVGCYGFKLENYECAATNELIDKRLAVQRFNDVCKYEDGYIAGDVQDEAIKKRILEVVEQYKSYENAEIDVLIATPPCQGMSVANHKKGDEKKRNSLVVQSIEIVNVIKPKFFVFENVRSFLSTICTDVDSRDKKIKEAIETNLGGGYNIIFKVINFKEYGNNSSRTRTLVVGTRKDLLEITPFDIFPDKKPERTLRHVIEDLPSLEFGEISECDIYHNFRPYATHMFDWIKDLKEGQSAFDNADPKNRPFKIIAGEKISNQNKNGDKYKKCYWDKIAPCIHTRNDILASQSTIHPKDNRVFSIRELMRMMTVPESFRWSQDDIKKLNVLSAEDKRKFLSKEELNIRQSIGEAVPTEIFRQIAEKIRLISERRKMMNGEIKNLVDRNKLSEPNNLKKFINDYRQHYLIPELFKIVELANAERLKNAAYYTRQDICFSLIKELPEAEEFEELNIIEPSVGAGNFLPLLFKKYESVKKVNLDLVDIDSHSIEMLKEMLKIIQKPRNFNINFLNQDFLLNHFQKKYDIVIGNPPFGKVINNPELLVEYKDGKFNKKTNNIFSYFIEESVKIGNFIALISPKSLLSAPEFNSTREMLAKYQFKAVVDYGEKGFSGVKIETISIVLDSRKKVKNDELVKVESSITNDVRHLKQDYLFPEKYPTWLLYRNKFFDRIAGKMKFNIFEVFRDRKMTKKHTKSKGKIRVLKSKNISSNEIVNIKDYDSFIDDLNGFPVKEFLNKPNIILVPNLTYNPRACFLPRNSIADGSVAMLTPKGDFEITKTDLEYYGSEEFRKFYMLARNLGTRSLNIDKNSVYFFGKLISDCK